MTTVPTRLSIRVKLVGTIIGLVAGIVVFQVMFFPQRQAEASLAALEAKGISLSMLAAHDAAAGLEFDDGEAVEQVFKGVAEDPDFAYITLLSETDEALAALNGELIPSHDAHEFYSDPVVRAVGNGFVHIEVPVVTTSGVKGHLLSGFSTATIQKQQSENLMLTGGAGGIVFLIGAAVALVLGQSLGSPMQRMAQQAERVAQGNIDSNRMKLTRSDELGQMANAFDDMMEMMSRIEGHLNVVANGDLTQDTGLQGDLAAALDSMVRSQRELVQQISETSEDIRLVSREVLASSEALERSAHEQAGVVDEAVRTMDEVLLASAQITTASAAVLSDAEETHANSVAMTDRINTLVEHTQRIHSFLEVIKAIAARTDLLALNAALEGTHAGEAGKGFSLVANQMQALTVNVVKVVEDIRGLTEDIGQATGDSVVATEDATQLALSTEQSAREIGNIIAGQRVGTEQVSQSMADINRSIRSSVDASNQSAAAARKLFDLSERLQERVSRFRLDG